MSFLEIFSFLITDVANPQSVTNEFLVANVILQLVGLVIIGLFNLYILWQWFKQKELRSNITPVLAINVALILRVFVTLVNRYVLYLSGNSKELFGITIYQTIPWILIFTFSNMLISKTIRVTKQREKALKLIKRFNTISIFMLLIAIILSAIGLTDQIVGLLGSLILLLVTIVIFITTILVRTEAGKTAAKLVKIRLIFYSYGIGFIAISFAITPFIIVLAISNLYPPSLAFVVSGVNLVLTVLSGLSFYYSLYIPTWMKKRFDLVINTSDLI
jgi:hypothetical protein